MKWIRERDALIAQTLAFVQSVSGKKDDLRQRNNAPATPVLAAKFVSAEPATAAVEPQEAEAAPQPFPVPPPRRGDDFRSEMQARIASFRQHQERFEREREEYCAATLSRLRAAISDPSLRPEADK
ncbi:hypothetical protein [Bradyrhizobium sp. Gha]|uniref:hypothetical protein n=1 Tax=Bradyrhizobium sp. Gha TaxID=1855318 RepID=UPI0008EE17F8|nr:hypothetical protein [Bradyrhizobium sp. Gha]SFI33187.1 hypothetical protein SAMN05216525_107148 [Bradyrhizobium sp. Gha]